MAAGCFAARRGALWTEVLAGKCARSLTPVQRAWVELFHAVGSRDSLMTRDRADVLIATPERSTTQRDYLVLAAVSARMARGENDAAKQMLDLSRIPLNRLEQAWFRYLAAVLAVRRNPK